MLYYNNAILDKFPDLTNYFSNAIQSDSKNIGHCILFWGPDIKSQCELALEISRLLNCKQGGEKDCECQNCKWIKEQAHPAVKIYTRLDFKEASTSSDDEESSSGKKNISIEQARAIINELSVSSDYHRVYIFCDRDEDGNLLPLNKINFPEVTSNALLKTFEEPPHNTTFIFLTKDKTDMISTVVSRSQSFFIPSSCKEESSFDIVENLISNYWNFNKNDVLKFEENLTDLIAENGAQTVFEQIQNYMSALMKENFNDKALLYKLKQDLKYVEDAKRQMSLTPSMSAQTVCENLSFKLFLS